MPLSRLPLLWILSSQDLIVSIIHKGRESVLNRRDLRGRHCVSSGPLLRDIEHHATSEKLKYESPLYLLSGRVQPVLSTPMQARGKRRERQACERSFRGNDSTRNVRRAAIRSGLPLVPRAENKRQERVAGDVREAAGPNLHVHVGVSTRGTEIKGKQESHYVTTNRGLPSRALASPESTSVNAQEYVLRKNLRITTTSFILTRTK